MIGKEKMICLLNASSEAALTFNIYKGKIFGFPCRPRAKLAKQGFHVVRRTIIFSGRLYSIQQATTTDVGGYNYYFYY